MSPPYALMATIVILVAGVISIFFEIGNTSVDKNPSRSIRLVSISTQSLGTALARNLNGPNRQNFANATLYGNPAEAPGLRSPSEGLRTYYTWGLWNHCAAYHTPSELQYCSPSKVANPFLPTAAILGDTPPQYATALSLILADETNGLKSDKTMGDPTKMAGFVLMSCIGHLVLLLPFCIFLLICGGSKSLCQIVLGIYIGTVISALIGVALWTSTISSLKSKMQSNPGPLNLGIEIEFGNGLWIMWGAAAVLIVGVAPFLGIVLEARRAAAEQADLDQYAANVIHHNRSNSH